MLTETNTPAWAASEALSARQTLRLRIRLRMNVVSFANLAGASLNGS
jgi:hypothetical protein